MHLFPVVFRALFAILALCIASWSAAQTPDTTQAATQPEPATQAQATSSQPLTLFPWKAEYRASYKAGVPINASAVRELKQQKDGTWLYNFDVDSFILDIKENSIIRWQDGLVVPVQYNYHRSGWVTTRKAQLNFDWSKLTVRNNVQNKPWTMSVSPGTQDKLSYQLQLHMDLIAGKKEMHYQVADGGKLKQMDFGVVGEEVLDTKLGKIATVYVDKLREPDAKRFTRLWFAKDLNYLLIKMIQKEEDGEVYEINLEKATINGKEVR